MSLRKLKIFPKLSVPEPSEPPPELLESVARANLAKLKCILCERTSLTSQGVSDGKLRIKCKLCLKTSYAYKHPQVVALITTELNQQTNSKSSSKSTLVTTKKNNFNPEMTHQDRHVPPESSLPMEPRANRLNEADFTQYDHIPDPNMSDSENETNTTMDYNDGQGSFNQLYHEIDELNYVVAEIQKNQKNTNNDINTIQRTLELILKKIQDIGATIKNDKDRHQETTQTRPPESTNKTIKNRFMPEEHENFRPWISVARRSQTPPRIPDHREQTTDLQRDTDSRNRFSALQQSIPSYQNMTYEEHMAPHPQRPTRRTTKIRDNLTPGQIENIKKGFSSKPFSPMVLLYFSGMKRNRPSEIRSMFKSIGIKNNWVRNIQFIGRSVLEITTFEDRKSELVARLENYEIKIIEDFDPLSIENLKDDRKFSGLTNGEKKEMAVKLHRIRMEKTIDRLPKIGVHCRLRNFLNATINPRQINVTNVENIIDPNNPITLIPATENTNTPPFPTYEIDDSPQNDILTVLTDEHSHKTEDEEMSIENDNNTNV